MATGGGEIVAAADFRVARTVGAEGEIEVAFAALQTALLDKPGGMRRIPNPQREALSVPRFD